MTKRMLTAVLTVALTLSLTACGGRTRQEMGETRTVYTMDTVMNLTAYGENASAALDAAEETLRTLDAKLDRHDETSTVSALNRDGTVEDAELAQLTDIAQTIGALSGGAFDPTVAPVMDAWDFTGDAPRVPSDEELSALLAHVGLEKLSVDGNTIALSDGAQLDLGGIAKGSGMIHPNLATMLVFLTTDCAVSPAMLQAALSGDVQDTFNMVSIDGDTSTNDMVAVLANGLAGNAEITAPGADFTAFCSALNSVTVWLCRQIAGDGEGATRLLECLSLIHI